MPRESKPSYYWREDKGCYWLNVSIRGKRIRRALPGNPETEAGAVYALNLFTKNEYDVLKAATLPEPTPDTSDPRIDELARWYIDTYLTFLQRAPKTITRYRQIINSFVAFCSDTRRGRFSQVSWTAVEEWLDSPRLSASYKRDAITILRRMFVAAYEQDKIPHLPIKKWLKPPKPHPSDSMHRALPPKELIAFVACMEAHAPAHIMRPVVFIAYTGIHVGDVVNLQWKHVDGVRSVLEFRKNKGGYRLTFPINDWVAGILKQCDPREPDEYVFLNKRGIGWANPHKLLNAMQYYAQSGGHPDSVSFRDLRKTFGDLCARGTFPYKGGGDPIPAHVLRRLMGHAKMETTLEHYTEVDDSDLRKAMG